MDHFHLSRFFLQWMNKSFILHNVDIQQKSGFNILQFFLCISNNALQTFFAWCSCFIYWTFHMIFNRKQEINHQLKSLRDIWKGVHFIFAVALEFYKLHSYFSTILLKLLVGCYNLLEYIKAPPFKGVFCRYLSNLYKMKMTLLVWLFLFTKFAFPSFHVYFFQWQFIIKH